MSYIDTARNPTLLAQIIFAAAKHTPTCVLKHRPLQNHGRGAKRVRTLERAATLTGVKIPFFAAVTPRMQQQRSSPTALDDAFTTTGLSTDPTVAGIPASMSMPPPPRTRLNVLKLMPVDPVRGAAKPLWGW